MNDTLLVVTICMMACLAGCSTGPIQNTLIPETPEVPVSFPSILLNSTSASTGGGNSEHPSAFRVGSDLIAAVDLGTTVSVHSLIGGTYLSENLSVARSPQFLVAGLWRQVPFVVYRDGVGSIDAEFRIGSDWQHVDLYQSRVGTADGVVGRPQLALTHEIAVVGFPAVADAESSSYIVLDIRGILNGTAQHPSVSRIPLSPPTPLIPVGAITANGTSLAIAISADAKTIELRQGPLADIVQATRQVLPQLAPEVEARSTITGLALAYGTDGQPLVVQTRYPLWRTTWANGPVPVTDPFFDPQLLWASQPNYAWHATRIASQEETRLQSVGGILWVDAQGAYQPATLNSINLVDGTEKEILHGICKLKLVQGGLAGEHVILDSTAEGIRFLYQSSANQGQCSFSGP